ncbi:MAG TPA: DUF3099 domain-containing protein [Pilimelia sp.]|nr:DUF3099 domain-containing protein [Pilimelia sp.]
MRHEPYRPILITDARQSQDDQLRSRKLRYTVMMGVRVGCLILGGALVAVDAPLLAVWLPVCAVGMVLIPWLAVLIANDRPPKDEHRLMSRFSARRTEEIPPRALPAEPAAHRVIDGEP